MFRVSCIKRVNFMVYCIALCNTTQYLCLFVFVCVCLFCLRVSVFLWGSLSVSVCLCLCVYLQRLTARDLFSSRRGQYPSHHLLCLFFSKRNFIFAFLFLMCTFLFFSSNKCNVPSKMFPIWQSRKRDFFVHQSFWHFLQKTILRQVAGSSIRFAICKIYNCLL